MEYPEQSAGGRMSVDYIAVRADWSAQRVWEHFRKVGREPEVVAYIYVLDAAGHLVGVASLRDLLLAEPHQPVSEFMVSKIVSVPATADQEEAARLLRRYGFLALPVVDERGRMLGVITAGDAFKVLDVEATEDFQRIGAVAPDEIDYPRAGIGLLWRRRVAWLLILLVADFLSSSVIAFYQEAIEAVVALAFFIPMLIDSGGNAGTQSATLIIRGLATGQVNLRDWLRVLRKEIGVGLLLGGTLGLVVYLRGFFWRGGPQVGLVLGLTMVTLVLWANLLGAVLPLLLRKLKLDPAVVSSPFITTAADVTGLVIYFSIAKWVLGL
jgi:magnesium transporter